MRVSSKWPNSITSNLSQYLKMFATYIHLLTICIDRICSQPSLFVLWSSNLEIKRWLGILLNSINDHHLDKSPIFTTEMVQPSYASVSRLAKACDCIHNGQTVKLVGRCKTQTLQISQAKKNRQKHPNGFLRFVSKKHPVYPNELMFISFLQVHETHTTLVDPTSTCLSRWKMATLKMACQFQNDRLNISWL